MIRSKRGFYKTTIGTMATMISVLSNGCMIVAFSVVLLFFPLAVSAAGETLVSSVAREYADGVDMDIVKAIARKLNARLEIAHAPFKRRLRMIKNGEIDFMVGLLKRPERERFIHYIHPPYKNRSDTVFFVQRGRRALIRSYEDLYPLRLGTILGSKYFQRFDEDPRLIKEAVPNSISNFKKLISGRIDAAVFPESAGIDLIHTLGIKDKLAIADYRFAELKAVYIGISKKSKLMDRIEETGGTIRSMIANEEIRRVIVDHYTQRGLPVPVF